ncbi:uncharacterized protein LOC143228887 isoform X2 [Tachypleus tridentatus]|uniref:uncharacterized protein LOC143228887 isoform X2 n=1 Tax=Tachypleus tridentatus TaxID=6853 RepID=UPI003FD285DA
MNTMIRNFVNVLVLLFSFCLIQEPFFPRGCISTRGQFPHEEFCYRYYDCWDGEVTIGECPGDLLFNNDPRKYYCDFPGNVDCTGRLTVNEITVKDGICQRRWGIYPDPTNCAAFYICINQVATRILCPNNTVYNSYNKVCVHVTTVDCEDRVPDWAFDDASTNRKNIY